MSADIEQPLSSQLAQMLMIGSPFSDQHTGTNDENHMEPHFATPNRTESCDLYLESLARTTSFDELQSPPYLDRVTKDEALSSPSLFHHATKMKGYNFNEGECMEIDWKLKNLMNSFDRNLLDETHSPSSSNIDPFNVSLQSQSLITPPSLEQTFSLRTLSRHGRTFFNSPIEPSHCHHNPSEPEILSTVQSFPVSTRNGQGLRRSLISPLQLDTGSISVSATSLLFPSPPTSPNKEDDRRIKRLKIVLGSQNNL